MTQFEVDDGSFTESGYSVNNRDLYWGRGHVATTTTRRVVTGRGYTISSLSEVTKFLLQTQPQPVNSIVG